MATWKCDLEGAQKLTVGSHFAMKCSGEPTAFQVGAPLRFVLPQEHRYKLKLLDTKEIEADSGSFVVTSWTVGDLRVEGAQLTDGATSVTLDPVEFTVATVIDREKTPEPKPFPPWNPLEIAWPIWFWAIIASIVLMAIGSAAMAVLAVVQKKRFLQRLKTHKPALTAFNQFSKELRKLVKSMPLKDDLWNKETADLFFAEMDQSFRWYVAREFLVPVLDGDSRQAIKAVRRGQPKLFAEFGKDLQFAFSEIEKAQRVTTGASYQDANQLVELLRTLTERLHQYAEQHASKKRRSS